MVGTESLPSTRAAKEVEVVFEQMIVQGIGDAISY